MIRAEAFVQELLRAGLTLFSGTPCSYLTPLINRVIDSTDLRYVGAVNEGEAVAIACGAELGGRPGVVLFQNSGLGNAVNPLTSLAAPFRIPLLVITTWRGSPCGKPDEPQHQLMGRITPGLLSLMEIPWEEVPADEAALAPMVERAAAHLRAARTPFGLILKEGVVAPSPLETQPGEVRLLPGSLPPQRPREPLEQDDVLQAIREGAGPESALLATTGYTGRALYGLGDTPNQFYMVGSMGCVSSVGLGLALAQPQRKVVVIDGDGAALMRLGALAILGYERPANLVHVLLDNGAHDSTGGQPTVTESCDLGAVAWACGYPQVLRPGSAAELEGLVRESGKGLTFIHVRTRPRSSRKLPRPEITPAEVAQRFRGWLKGARA